MVLRKITIDNSVRCIPKSEQTKERDSKLKTTKAGSLPRKQNKKFLQNNKSLLESFLQQVLLHCILTSERIIKTS